MKISIITVSYNAKDTIADAMESVCRQCHDGFELEYLVIDGGSKDGTVDIIKAAEQKMEAAGIDFRWVSEKDNGLYDAMNKGIRMATGDIVGILNADDVFEADDTLSHIAMAFMSNVEAVYADIRFVEDADTLLGLRSGKTVRYCSARRWKPWMFRFGAMVPHPSFYARRECFEKLGNYSLDYRICSDFELELRFLGLAKLRTAYLPECVVAMRMGGASTAGWRSNVEINREDLRALRSHGIWSCLPLIYLKYLFKVWGFVFRSRIIGGGGVNRLHFVSAQDMIVAKGRSWDCTVVHPVTFFVFQKAA